MTCPGSHGQPPGQGPELELPGRELNLHAQLSGISATYPLSSPNMPRHPPSPKTTYRDSLKMFSCLAPGGSFPFSCTVLHWGHMAVSLGTKERSPRLGARWGGHSPPAPPPRPPPKPVFPLGLVHATLRIGTSETGSQCGPRSGANHRDPSVTLLQGSPLLLLSKAKRHLHLFRRHVRPGHGRSLVAALHELSGRPPPPSPCGDLEARIRGIKWPENGCGRAPRQARGHSGLALIANKNRNTRAILPPARPPQLLRPCPLLGTFLL